MLSSTCQHVATLQFDSCAINAMVFLPLAQAPPRADPGAKEVLYSLQSKFDPSLHPCFQRTCFM